MNRERCAWCGRLLPTSEARAIKICPPCVDSVLPAGSEAAAPSASNPPFDSAPSNPIQTVHLTQ